MLKIAVMTPCIKSRPELETVNK